MIVCDASISLNWYLEDEATDDTDAVNLIVRAQGAVVPSFWPIEIANALNIAKRKGKIGPAYRDAAIGDLLSLNIEIAADTAAHLDAILAIADRYTLTVYDACYVELARRLGLTLATTDNAMAAAAQAEDVTVLP